MSKTKYKHQLALGGVAAGVVTAGGIALGVATTEAVRAAGWAGIVFGGVVGLVTATLAIQERFPEKFQATSPNTDIEKGVVPVVEVGKSPAIEKSANSSSEEKSSTISTSLEDKGAVDTSAEIEKARVPAALAALQVDKITQLGRRI
jgi:hypothetical protein